MLVAVEAGVSRESSRDGVGLREFGVMSLQDRSSQKRAENKAWTDEGVKVKEEWK